MGAINVDLSYEAITSFIDDAELNHIIPAIGYPLYNALLAAITTNTLTEKQTRALALIRKAEANFTIHYFVAFGAVGITESGIYVTKDATHLPASDKKLYLLRMQSRADGFRALEAAVNYLEANLADFPAYATDVTHQLNRRFYINTTDEFSRGFNLGQNAEVFSTLKAVMETVEENYIDPLLGDDLSAVLRAAILTGSLSADQQKLVTKITKAVALLSIAEAIPYRLVNIEANGLVTSTTKGNIENIEVSTEGDQRRLQGMMNMLQMRGESEMGKLTKWLNDHASDFSGYVVTDLLAKSKMNDDERGVYFV
ncbi:MAG: hypothetical protein JWQ54_1829 [Mucilaginibacter sp.]|nr:hypothetical protein [Mucilaginibacter sp.]